MLLMMLGACSAKKPATVETQSITDMRGYSDGLAAVRVNSKWGYVDKNGAVVITPQFNEVLDFADGVAAVKFDKKWGCIDEKGQYVIIPHYEAMGELSQGLIPAEENGRWGFISTAHQTVIPFQFAEAKPFSQGLAAVRLGKFWGYIDKKGTFVINPRFAYAGKFESGLAPVSENSAEDSYGYINTKGEYAIAPQFDAAGEFSEKMAAVYDDGKWGYINSKGMMIINLLYDEADLFEEGLAAVMKAGEWGYINSEGATVIDFQFAKAFAFTDGKALVSGKNGQSFYINDSGKPANSLTGVLALGAASGAVAAEAVAGGGSVAIAGSEKKSEYREGSKAGFIILPPVKYFFQEKDIYLHFTTDEARMFYSFHPADKEPTTKPIFVMLNGGPGAATTTNLFAMNTGPYTLMRDDQTDGSPGYCKNPNSWTKLGNILYIDASMTGYSYLSTPKSRTKNFRYTALLGSGNFNPFIDAAQIIRTILGVLKEQKDYEKCEIVLVGESYGGTRVSTMLNLLLFNEHYADGSRIYKDTELVKEIKEHFDRIGYKDPNKGGDEVPPEVVARQFKRQVLIQPQLTGASQDDITAKMFYHKGGYNDSFMQDLAVETGHKGEFNKYNPFSIWHPSTYSCWDRESQNCAIMYWVSHFGRDRYNVSKPNKWSDDLEAYSMKTLTSVKGLSTALQYDVTAIKPMYSSERLDALKQFPFLQKWLSQNIDWNATDDGGAEYVAEGDREATQKRFWDDLFAKSPGLEEYMPPDHDDRVKMLIYAQEQNAVQELGQEEAASNRQSLTSKFGILSRHDAYMIGMNVMTFLAYSGSLENLQFSINPGKTDRYGKMFLENISLVKTFLTDAKYDSVIYSPAIPECLKLYKDVVSSITYKRGKDADKPSKLGTFEISYQPKALAPYPTPKESVKLFYPYYENSGHSVSTSQPDKFRDDVEAWMKQ